MPVNLILAGGWKLESKIGEKLFYEFPGSGAFVKNDMIVEVFGQLLMKNEKIILRTRQLVQRNREEVLTALSISTSKETLAIWAENPPERLDFEGWGLSITFFEDYIDLIALHGLPFPGNSVAPSVSVFPRNELARCEANLI